MTSSRLYYVALTLLCLSTFVAVNNAQTLSQEELRSLREYLLGRDELPQQLPDVEGEQEDTAEGPTDTQFAYSQEGVDQQTSDQAEQIPADNDATDVSIEERSWKEDRRNKTKPGKPRDKSSSDSRYQSLDTKKLYGLKVVKAEKFRYGGNGPFYTETGVVVTVEDGVRFLIRRTNPNGAVTCWGNVDCDKVVIIYADHMTKNWELVATKEPKELTVGDYIKTSQSVSGRNTAADAMMALD